LSGISSSLFLHLLKIVTTFRQSHTEIIWFLPVSGALIGYAYLKYGKKISGGNSLVFEEIHNPKSTIPLRMTPMVLFSTLITHLFGGSTGREGTSVQMGASLADQFSKYIRVNKEERNILIMAGMGSGFSAAIGAPIAGAIFAMEVISIGNFKLQYVFEILVSCFVGYYLSVFLATPHTLFPKLDLTSWEIQDFILIAFSGILFGLTARIFSLSVHKFEFFINKLVKNSILKPFLFGLLIVILYLWEGTFRFAGLGIESILNSFNSPSSIDEPLFKTIFTGLSLGSGFKGGEFIPLVFIGSTLGSFLSTFIPVSVKLLAAVGFVSVFAGAANVPLACTIMAGELFGYQIVPFAFVGCMMSYFFSGHRGIYKSQKISKKKLIP
jgi:H+/Cl- antiporter ClcA